MTSTKQFCSCGYLVMGTVPASLCFDCGDRVLAEWVAAEKQLLNRVPAYAAAVSELISKTATLQSKAIRARTNEPAADAAWERQKADKQLSCLRRVYRAEIARIDQARWVELSEIITQDPRETLRKEAKRLRKRGWGAAALTALRVEAVEILARVITTRNDR